MGKYHALILAKSGSKRLKDKNILWFHGKPMFLVNIEKCVKIFEKVFVSSDSELMLREAKEVGAIPIKRGQDLCGDTPNIPVYQHALKHMGELGGIIAVQANSPNLEHNLIVLAKNIMESGAQELLTCHEDYSIYGSIWAISKLRLDSYPDPYNPKPDVMLVDTSVDIHTRHDYNKALLL